MYDEKNEADLSTLEPFDPTEFDGIEVGVGDTSAGAPGDVPELAGIDTTSIDDLSIFETTS